MFFQFFAQEINIVKDILVKPAVACLPAPVFASDTGGAGTGGGARSRQDGSGTAILAVETQPGSPAGGQGWL